MKEIKNIKAAYTHAGVFHADDVFATAFLQMINPDIEINRTNNPPECDTEELLVFDIGGGRYDHHEEPERKELRDDGTPYAAFGKLWRDFSSYLVDQEVADRIDRDFIKPLDITDNTGEPNQLSSVIDAMNPTWAEEMSLQGAFDAAVSLARTIFERIINQKRSEERAREIVLSSEKTDGVLILEKFVPWKETIVTEMPDISFVLYPSLRGGYNLQGIPVSMDSRQNRVAFPEEWLGKTNEKLGITFCHPGNFLLATETLSQAIEVARLAKKNKKISKIS